jgi:acetyltransferase-like isoleucine patch superfamily enzyme
MYILLFFKNIKIGKSSMFYNRAYFCRHPESEIIIGSHCRFDSTKFKNLIGVNKRCIIATLLPNAKLEIGNLNGFSGVRIGCAENISIGNDCLVGANVTITDSDWHAIDPQERHNEYAQKTQPVKIGNNVFIGLNSIILKGSEIGDNSVIGAGSVVSGTIPPNVIAAGNPCKIIKRI